jgi:hypothetical protein
MSPQNKGVYCLANDNVAEWFEAFIRSFRRFNPDMPLTLIPFNESISRLKALQSQFQFDIMEEAPCRRFDALAMPVMGTDRLAGTYRKFACFFGPYDEFLFLDSDVMVLTALPRLFEAYAKSNYDFVFFDYNLDMAYAPVLATQMLAKYGSPGFNSGAFLSRKGVLREADLLPLAHQAATVRDGLLPGVLEQSFINYVMDVTRQRMTGIEKLLPDLADQVWARQPFSFNPKTEVARNPAGKILPFIHWPGCAHPTMVRPEIFLKYRTLGMTAGERKRYFRKFYCCRFRRNCRNILLKLPIFSSLMAWRDQRRRLKIAPPITTA